MPSRALLAALLFAAPLAAQETLFQQQPDPKSNTRVEAVALFSRPSPGGFLPVRVTVTNAGEQDGDITLRCVANDGNYGGEGSEMNSSYKLDAPAGKSTKHDILIPCNTLLNYGYASLGTTNVTVTMSGSFGANSGSVSGSYLHDQPAVLLSEPLYTPNASTLDSQLSSSGRSSGYGAINFAGKFDPREMPEDWRAYSGYDGIGMTDGDWGLLSPGARNAILRWNRLGGQIVIYAQSANSDLATLGISNLASGQKSAQRSFGSVSIVPAGGSLSFSTDQADEMIARFKSKDNLPPLNSAIRGDFSSSWPLQIDFGNEGYNYMLFILILIGFGVLVGPVNLFVFAKSGQRHRLFITTPIIALGTSLLLVVLIIVIDGFGGRGARVALMEVRPDDGENSAYIFQEQVSRTGVLLGGGFGVGEPAAITPVPLASSQWSRLTDRNNGGGMRYEANLRDNKLEVDGDWFQSRSEQGQLVRAIVPTRGRIELRSTSGPPSLISTFDFPIEKIYYRDSSDVYWCAENIERGKAFEPRQVQPTEVLSFVNEAKSKLSTRSKEALSKLSPLERGDRHFIAVSAAAPGIDTFKGIEWKETKTFITGPVALP
ncbi:hypothetical protein OJ996_17375 [Luteolibacter sp. GHJ8]|uniref:Uncharacterized protein n=1 Tax=Luteolibacter rhizosphaerae TaxID=2989719 RepID=A0ABT3G7C4_9BACT|nr:hypothetical protein [Luteolibacter rhizosphaerae]MCW1915359.1 hypothetical protein [Luteolibacter rhizosphaerae]